MTVLVEHRGGPMEVAEGSVGWGCLRVLRGVASVRRPLVMNGCVPRVKSAEM